MQFLTFLPLMAAALAVGLMFISPLPVKAHRIYEHHYQGRNSDRDDSRVSYQHHFDRPHDPKLNPSGSEAPYKQVRGSRRDAVTGVWSPYR